MESSEQFGFEGAESTYGSPSLLRVWLSSFDEMGIGKSLMGRPCVVSDCHTVNNLVDALNIWTVFLSFQKMAYFKVDQEGLFETGVGERIS